MEGIINQWFGILTGTLRSLDLTSSIGAQKKNVQSKQILLSCGFTIPHLGPDVDGLYICVFRYDFVLLYMPDAFVQYKYVKVNYSYLCVWVFVTQLNHNKLVLFDCHIYLNNRSTVTEYSTLNLKTDTTYRKGSSLKTPYSMCVRTVLRCTLNCICLGYWEWCYVWFYLCPDLSLYVTRKDCDDELCFLYNALWNACIYQMNEICNITFLMKDFGVNLFNFLTLYHIFLTQLNIILIIPHHFSHKSLKTNIVWPFFL